MKKYFFGTMIGLLCVALSWAYAGGGKELMDLVMGLFDTGGVLTGGLITGGRTTDCTTNCAGGVEKFWITNVADVASTTEDSTGVTAITMEATKVFWEVEFYEETGQFIENVTVQNCAVVVDQSLTTTWRCRDQTDRNVIDELSNACCGMIVIHLEATGLTWIWGHNEKQRVRLRTSNGDSGTTFDSVNQEVVTIGARAKQKAVVFVPGEAGVPLT